MRQLIHFLQIPTKTKGLIEITEEVKLFLGKAEISTGLMTLFCRHTSASLLIQENADPDVQTDLEAFFDEIAPEDEDLYVHNAEGPDDMPAHIKSALTSVNLSIPVASGKMVLGTWQGIYLFEHRNDPHNREVVLHLLGE
jgi:secondary thiamine-phosphate synthase enzyme